MGIEDAVLIGMEEGAEFKGVLDSNLYIAPKTFIDMVYVQDINGKPMMPTTRHGKVRRLLKENKAVVVSLCPFTIKLTYVKK